MINRLANEASPYLLQHADNPVDWRPWGKEALETARREDKAIFLSVGYAACHWCHVMAHESFEDEETAALINERFIPIKVDREERPDLDSLYIQAVQAMTGSAGWPLSVFLTPDGMPFYGGTYFPPTPRHGMPSFKEVLLAVSDAWENRRQETLEGSQRLVAYLQKGLAAQPGPLSEAPLQQLARQAHRHFDQKHGGFSGAPKFPQPALLAALLHAHLRSGDPQALRMVTHTLRQMAQGGIYDHLGGGFHRYSVDARWLVPHFEKMLYDNAQLARLYLHAFLLTGEPLFRRVTEETLDYILREMAHPDGGLYSTQDADSEGEEGLFYLWTPSEIEETLGEEGGTLFCAAYGVQEEGNFEGRTILHRARPLEKLAGESGTEVSALEPTLTQARAALYRSRSQRVWPGRDEKVLTGWNGLALSALAEAGAALGRQDLLTAARRLARFLRDHLHRHGRLYRAWRDGDSRALGVLEDYGALAEGLALLYEATGEREWLNWAVELAEGASKLFWDGDKGLFYDTGSDHEQLIARPRDVTDGAVPSGTSLIATALLRLAVHTGREDLHRRGIQAIAGLVGLMERIPLAMGQALVALDLGLGPVTTVVIVGPKGRQDTAALLDEARSHLRPRTLAVQVEPHSPTDSLPLLMGREMRQGRATAYVCRASACLEPTTDPATLRRLLQPSTAGHQET